MWYFDTSLHKDSRESNMETFLSAFVIILPFHRLCLFICSGFLMKCQPYDVLVSYSCILANLLNLTWD